MNLPVPLLTNTPPPLIVVPAVIAPSVLSASLSAKSSGLLTVISPVIANTLLDSSFQWNLRDSLPPSIWSPSFTPPAAVNLAFFTPPVYNSIGVLNILSP